MAEITDKIVKTGQKAVAVTGTAIKLSDVNGLTNGAIVKADSANAAPIVIGGSSITNTVDGTGNGFVLVAGESISVPVADLSNIFINGTSGDHVYWIAN